MIKDNKKFLIKYVNWGTANHFGTHIEINKIFQKYPDLHDYLLVHELDHSENMKFSFKDLWLDIKTLKPDRLSFKLGFVMLIHPSTLTQLSPIIRREGKTYYDINNIILTLFLFVLSLLQYFLYVNYY